MFLFSYVGPICFLPEINSRLATDNFCFIVRTHLLPSGEAPFSHSIARSLIVYFL
jgi:hypothetical protein